ncbi:hypothetical protein ACYOEI_01935 [Singulisphaera rosea]
MDVKHSLAWLVDGSVFHLNTLEHQDLEELYRRRLLPVVEPLRSRIDKFVFGGDQADSRAVEALHLCLESFRAMLAASLRKAQPWLSEHEAAYVVEIHCGNGDNATLYRQVRSLGSATLKNLASKHRGRFIDLVSLAMVFESLAATPQEAEDGS